MQGYKITLRAMFAISSGGHLMEQMLSVGLNVGEINALQLAPGQQAMWRWVMSPLCAEGEWGEAENMFKKPRPENEAQVGAAGIGTADMAVGSVGGYRGSHNVLYWPRWMSYTLRACVISACYCKSLCHSGSLQLLILININAGSVLSTVNYVRAVRMFCTLERMLCGIALHDIHLAHA